MEINLEPNGIITNRKSLLVIYFSTNDLKTALKAFAFEIIDGQRVQVTEKSTLLGTQLILEGVVKELNYHYEIANDVYVLNDFDILKNKLPVNAIKIEREIRIKNRRRN